MKTATPVKFFIHPDIAALDPYVPGKPIAALERELGISGAIKLASNENPLGPSKKAVAAVRTGLKNIARYPDGAGQDLSDALAARWRVPRAQIVLGNGSDEIIALLARVCLMPGDEAVMARPTFSIYRLTVAAAHARPVEIPLKAGRHDLAAMARAVTPKTRLIFVCNPNNPTGTMVSQAEVARFLARVPKRVLVVFDEAYAEYATAPDFPRMTTWVREGAPVVMLRTFSKIYGLAGLRIGYGVGPLAVMDAIQRVRAPFNTNLLAQGAALAALSDDTHVARALAVNREGMAYLTRQLDAMGLAYFPSQGNFICFTLNGTDDAAGQRVYAALLRQGVILRHFAGRTLRVTLGLPRENRRFIRALKSILSHRAI